MIVFGYRTKGERVSSIDPYDSFCPCCGTVAEFVAKMPVTRFTLYWIPTIRLSGKKPMFQQCQNCETAYTLSDQQALQLVS